MNISSSRARGILLPDFCRWQFLFAAMAVALICVLIVQAAKWGPPHWQLVGIYSVFSVWLVVISVALLCLFRPLLSRLPGLAAYWGSWLLVIAVSVLTSLAALWINQALQLELFAGGIAPLELVLRLVFIVGLVAAALLRYLYVHQLWQQEVMAQNEARVQALQSRIRPHFLFNSLNSIASLIADDPDNAEMAIEDLADLFRGALRQADRLISLEEELELARKYLAMEQRRIGARLTVDWQVERLPKDATVPALLLQPLVENAVYHGIQPRTEGGVVTVSGARDDDNVVIVVTNPLAATPSDTSSNRVALENIRERLFYHYAGRGDLLTKDSDGNFQAIIRIPYVVHNTG